MLQYVSQLYVQVPLSSLRYKLLKCCNMYLNCMFRSSLSFFTLQATEMLQYVSQLYIQVSLSYYVTSYWNVAICISTVCSGLPKLFTLQATEMLQYVSQLYVQVLLSSLRYKLLKCCNTYLNCMFRSS